MISKKTTNLISNEASLRDSRRQPLESKTGISTTADWMLIISPISQI